MEILSANEKLLFGRIMGLVSKKGYCYASNTWLGNNFCLEKKSVSAIIAKLAEKELINVEIIRDNGKVVERRIYVLSTPPPPSIRDTSPLSMVHTISSREEGSSSSRKEVLPTQEDHEITEADITYVASDEDGNPLKVKKVKIPKNIDIGLEGSKLGLGRTQTIKTKIVPPFNYELELEHLKTSTFKPNKILRLFFLRKQYTFENRAQFDAAIKRNIRAAKSLEGYSSVQINEAMDKVEEHATKMDYEWSLETISKAIINTANKG